MHRTEGVNNVNNLFVDGNPGLNEKGTFVEKDWLNAVQAEIIGPIEDVGITLVKGTNDQLLVAIKALISQGGAPAGMDLVDGVGPVTVTAIPILDKTLTKSATVLVDVYRENDTQHSNELFKLTAIFDPTDDDWVVLSEKVSADDELDSGTTFTITSAGQIQYTTTAFAGSGYSGKLRQTGLTRIPITV